MFVQRIMLYNSNILLTNVLTTSHFVIPNYCNNYQIVFRNIVSLGFDLECLLYGVF